MRNLKDEIKWNGNADALAERAKLWLVRKGIGSPSFEPNERLVRDYVAKEILGRPERIGKEALFGFRQLLQFLACRKMIEDKWPLPRISEQVYRATEEELMVIIGESIPTDALELVSELREEVLAKPHSQPQIREKRATRASKWDNNDRSFSISRRQMDSFVSRSEMHDTMRIIGSDLPKPIKQQFTAFQLATWLVLLMDTDKVEGLSSREAEAIGRSISTALSNPKSLISKSDLEDEMRRLSELENRVSELQEQNFRLEQDRRVNEELMEMKLEERTSLMASLAEKLDSKEREIEELRRTVDELIAKSKV
jgi:hypothetical protein